MLGLANGCEAGLQWLNAARLELPDYFYNITSSQLDDVKCVILAGRSSKIFPKK